jgi:outer membrane autotransporter protein
VVSTIGDVGYRVNGLTYDPVSRNLYATTSSKDANFASGLITINRTTGAATRVGAGSGLALVNVVTASSDGRLFGWTENTDDLVVWDRATGTATVVGASGLSTAEQTLAFDRQTDTLFLINQGRVYTIDTATGAATQVATVSGMAHHGDFAVNGRVYAIDASGSGAKNIRIIDPATGAEIGTLATANDLHTLAFVLFTSAANPLPPAISAADTLAAMQRNGANLRRIFSLMASTVNPGLSYDCTTFDARGACVGVIGRHTSTSSTGGEATSGVLIGAYKVNPNVRVGGFIEQRTGSVSVPGIRLDNGAPAFGVFGTWSQNPGGEGYSVRGAYRYSKSDVTITRSIVGTSELGMGTADLTTQGVQLTVNRGMRIHPAWAVSPYVGLRHVRVERDGYTEAATITAPLTYAGLTETSTQLLLGANVAGQVASKVTLLAGLGVEHDVKHRTSDYSATGVAGLTPFQFNDDLKRTRPVASVGVKYSLQRHMELSAQLVYRKEAFGSTSTTTGLVAFTAGF